MLLNRPPVNRPKCARTPLEWPLFLALLLLASPIHAADPIAAPDVAEHFGLRVVVDVLANDIEPDGEALTVHLDLGNTDCEGQVSEDFGVIRLAPTSGGPETCTISYWITDELDNASQAVDVTVIPSHQVIFVDGFESGDTMNWEVGS